jgi:exopolyphosphatase / guanosine-5'-triphosphate,3'-diphosphate pyrophosphatase
VGARCFSLQWNSNWASRFPQSMHLLQQEILAWQKTPWALRVEAA